MAQKWFEKLRQDEVKEFSLYPHAFTPLTKEKGGFALPEIEADFDAESDDDKDSSNPQNSTPSWVKNLSFTVGGITIGAAAVYGLFAGGAPPPACVVPTTQQAVNTQTSIVPKTPASSNAGMGKPAGTPATPATTPSATTSTSSSPAAGTI